LIGDSIAGAHLNLSVSIVFPTNTASCLFRVIIASCQDLVEMDYETLRGRKRRFVYPHPGFPRGRGGGRKSQFVAVPARPV